MPPSSVWCSCGNGGRRGVGCGEEQEGVGAWLQGQPLHTKHAAYLHWAGFAGESSCHDCRQQNRCNDAKHHTSPSLGRAHFKIGLVLPLTAATEGTLPEPLKSACSGGLHRWNKTPLFHWSLFESEQEKKAQKSNYENMTGRKLSSCTHASSQHPYVRRSHHMMPSWPSCSSVFLWYAFRSFPPWYFSRILR